MNEELLFRKIATSSNPIEKINKLKGEISVGFVEYLNRSTFALSNQKRLPDALRVNEWAQQAAHNLGDHLMEAHTLFNGAQLERDLGDLDNAEKYFRKAFQLYEKHGSLVDIFDGTAGLLENLASRGKNEELKRVAQHTLNKVQETGQFTGDIKTSLLKICHILRLQNDTGVVRTYIELLLQLGEQFGDRESEAEASGLLAEVIFDENPKEAQRLFQRALEYDRLTNRSQLQAIDLGNLGNVSFRLGELEKAAKYYIECIAIRDREAVYEGMDTDLFRFYHVLHYLGRRPEAMQVHNRMMELTSGSPTFIKPIAYHIRLDDRGREKDGIEFGQP
jgi:tetratricopeptide (TPR) repeat protein